MARRPLLIDRRLLINHPRSMEGKFVDINQPTFLFYEREREKEREILLFARARRRNLSGWRDKKGSSIETVISSIVYVRFSFLSFQRRIIQYLREGKKRGTNIDLFEEESRGISPRSLLDESEFRGEGCVHPRPRRKKETRYGRYHGRNNNLLSLPP